MLNRIVRIFGGDPNKRAIQEYADLVDEINSLEDRFENLSEEDLRAQTDQFRLRLANGETPEDILPEAFATVREASKRTIGLRHYDVQLIGGAVLHEGRIAEMRTGEGKTLVATLPLYLNALALNPEWVRRAQQKWGENPENWSFKPLNNVPVGRGAHLITVNDYLARRDARWKAPIYHLLGMKVGVLQMAARTEGGRRAFMVNLETSSPHEDQDQLDLLPRQEAYLADLTYGTNSEYGFDYLRDNMTLRMEDRVQRGHHYAIIDEVDNVLIDEARTPLIISGPAHDDTEWYVRMSQVVKQLKPEDYEINEKDRTATLTEIGETHVEAILDMPLRDPERPEDITLEQERLLGYLEQAMRAQYLYKRNKDYLVQGGKVVIVDVFTGRLMPGRRWSDGLHQAVEAKEGVKIQGENVTYATITIQNYFRMYEKLAGMTGTALTEAEEFHKIYDLEVLAIPTNLEYQAERPELGMVAVEDKDSDGYKFTYYARADDPEKQPLFWKRKDFPDVVFRSEEAKMRAIVQEILHDYVKGRPLLVGTTSVELSERLSGRLRADSIRKLAQILLIRATWFEKHNRVEDGRQVLELMPLNDSLDRQQPAELRKLARELGLTLNFKDEENLQRLLRVLRLAPEDADRLSQALQGGVSSQVLNARKHTEESQIIAGAGAFGAVTIATNMAGRGVDIKLGGELDEQVLSDVNRILRRAGHEDPYELTVDQRETALKKIDPEDFGIYEDSGKHFLESMEQMRRVRELGGLHVIGSERHEARRIDNQLRGRSSRQGDPGSSRFYLSMEDELMRLFGGEQANEWMQRLNVDEALPLENRFVDRIIEQAQTRVEGANFDSRKHLLEYDDVLNTQRSTIYGQRDRIFEKDDLSEDVLEMLETEILERVPPALEDPEGPWRLLAWLEQIQPPLTVGNRIFPSYTFRTLFQSIVGETLDKGTVRERLLEIVESSLSAEEEHLIAAAYELLEVAQTRMEADLKERLETVDTFFEGLRLADETDTRNARELLAELSGIVRLSIQLSPDEQRALLEDPYEVQEVVERQVESQLFLQSLVRLLGAVARRLEEDLELAPQDLTGMDWEQLGTLVFDTIEGTYTRRKKRLIGEKEDGQIPKDLDKHLSDMPETLDDSSVYRLLLLLPQGARAVFDRKTHKRVWQRTTRLNYVHYAAQVLDRRDPDELTEEVLAHLQDAQIEMQRAWGRAEIQRLAGAKAADLGEKAVRGLQNTLGATAYEKRADTPLGSLPDDIRVDVILELGRQAITEVYRQLLLRVISDLWVEYLTQMEALRVSIGLEAYAQRDPLVQYKSRAFEMFRKLLSDMRIGVVTRMYTYSPRDMAAVRADTREGAEAPADVVSAGNGAGRDTPAAMDKAPPAADTEGATEISKSAKRRRRRRKRK